MGESLTILLDLDGMAADLWTHSLKNINEKWGTAFTLADMKEYNFAKNVGRPRNEAIKAAGWLDPGFYANLPLIPGCREVIEGWVKAHHKVFIATACLIEAPWAAGNKIARVHKELPFINKYNIFVGHQKYMLKADVAMDDSPSVIREMRHHQPSVYCFGLKYAYNAALDESDRDMDDKRVYLADDWSQLDGLAKVQSHLAAKGLL